MKLDKKDKTEILENAFSYIVVLAMFAYGVGKIVQFDGAINSSKLVSEMTGMELMWAFYGYSKPFVIVLGVLEISGGILMLIRRTRLLGSLLVSTILINVILQDIFYGVHVGALKAALIYQSLIFIILWFNRERVVKCFKILTSPGINRNSGKKFFLILFLSGLLFVGLRIVEYYITKW